MNRTTIPKPGKTIAHVGNPALAAKQNFDAVFRQLARQPGAKCAHCGKSFSRVLKPATVIAVQTGAFAEGTDICIGVVVSNALLCRPCTKAVKAGSRPDKAMADSEQFAGLAFRPTQGTA